MVSPLIFLLLIHQTWAPWRPTSISHLIIFLKSVTYYSEISVIKLERREKKEKTYCLRNLYRTFFFFFCLEEVGKSCRCALRRCSSSYFYHRLHCICRTAVLLYQGPLTTLQHPLTLELCHHMTLQEIAINYFQTWCVPIYKSGLSTLELHDMAQLHL